MQRALTLRLHYHYLVIVLDTHTVREPLVCLCHVVAVAGQKGRNAGHEYHSISTRYITWWQLLFNRSIPTVLARQEEGYISYY